MDKHTSEAPPAVDLAQSTPRGVMKQGLCVLAWPQTTRLMGLGLGCLYSWHCCLSHLFTPSGSPHATS